MANEGSNYKHYIPALDLSIERYTNRVPPDGKYHLIQRGNIIGSFRSKKQAEEKFYQIVKESGYKPETSDKKPIDQSELALQKYFDSKAIFWTEGPISRRGRGKGGRGGRGGV
jgi:hypothetical protein